MDESAARFVAKMREAAFNDLDHKVNRQAALAKVRMLESVKTQLNKYDLNCDSLTTRISLQDSCCISRKWHLLMALIHFSRHCFRSHLHNTFLDNGILEAMTLWLEPLQDSSFSLPSLDIIQDFLAILDVVCRL